MSCGPLRQYTYRFARNLIQLFPAMMEEKHHESLPPVRCTISPSIFCFQWFSFFLVPLRSLRITFIPNASRSFLIGPALEMRSTKPSRFWSCFESLPTVTFGTIRVIWEMYLHTVEGVNYSKYPAAIGELHFPPTCEAPSFKELT